MGDDLLAATRDDRCVSGVRVGRRVELTVDAPTEGEARAVVDRLASELLSNPLIEAYAVELLGAGSATTSRAKVRA